MIRISVNASYLRQLAEIFGTQLLFVLIYKNGKFFSTILRLNLNELQHINDS